MEKAVPHKDERVLHLDTADVRRTLKRIRTWKAPGPDNIPGQVLRECTDQLACVQTINFTLDIITPHWTKPLYLHVSPSSQCQKNPRSHIAPRLLASHTDSHHDEIVDEKEAGKRV